MIFSMQLEELAKIAIIPFKNNPKVKLVFVMIIFPVIFNALCFWITDNIIKSDMSACLNTKHFNKDEENLLLKNGNEFNNYRENNIMNNSYINKITSYNTNTSYISNSCKKCKEIYEWRKVKDDKIDENDFKSFEGNNHLCKNKCKNGIEIISENNQSESKLNRTVVYNNEFIIEKLNS